MTETDIRDDAHVQKDDAIFDHCHLIVAYIVIQVCMWTATITMSVNQSRVTCIREGGERSLLTRAHNSQPVIGKGARRAAAAAAAVAQRSAPLRGTKKHNVADQAGDHDLHVAHPTAKSNRSSDIDETRVTMTCM